MLSIMPLRGLLPPVNRHQQCQVWQLGGCNSPLGMLGRGEILYLGAVGLGTPIWDVLAPQGEQ